MSIVRKYQQSPNYSPGRPAGAPNTIVIHYWDDPARKPRFEGVVSWLCRPRGNSSIHYVVEDGRWTQLVSEDDRAWHAGPKGNPRGIGIECNPRMSKGDLETTAQLIANIRRRLGNLPLRPHNHYMSTSCPGSWEGQLGWLDRRANEINGGAPAPAPTPAPAPSRPAGIATDGYWGTATTKRLQAFFGTPADGIVSAQSAYWRSQNPGLTSGWQWVNPGVAAGSLLIAAIQRRLGVKGDGLLGPATINALSARYGIRGDGRLDRASITIKAMQRKLNEGSF